MLEFSRLLWRIHSFINDLCDGHEFIILLMHTHQLYSKRCVTEFFGTGVYKILSA